MRPKGEVPARSNPFVAALDADFLFPKPLAQRLHEFLNQNRRGASISAFLSAVQMAFQPLFPAIQCGISTASNPPRPRLMFFQRRRERGRKKRRVELVDGLRSSLTILVARKINRRRVLRHRSAKPGDIPSRKAQKTRAGTQAPMLAPVCSKERQETYIRSRV